MDQNVVMQWILYFYIYCFIGWVWECCYESVRYRKWVNRGFMRGPFLPIYGFGAMAMLLTTIPVREYWPLVFLVGMAAATLLEYFTGVLMEKLFHMRYWDYSGQFLNIKGHICLKCSLAWGCFSLLLVQVIHVKVEQMVAVIPDQIEQGITFCLTLVIVADFTVSFYEAMDLRRLLETVLENSEDWGKLHERLENVSALLEEDKELVKQSLNEHMRNLNKKAYRAAESILKRNPGAVSKYYKRTLQQIWEQVKNRL